jgi:hypothetical protein
MDNIIVKSRISSILGTNKAWRTLFFGGILFFLNLSFIIGQTKIADWLPGCMPQEPPIKLGMLCNGGTSNFGVIAGVFTVQNIDGITCCTGPMGGGDGSSYFEFEPVNISCFTNVTVTMQYSAAATGYEDDDPVNPIFGCTGNNPPDNSHDQIVFMYSIDGGPFVQSLYVHGTTAAAFTGTWTQAGLAGTTLTIRVYASNKATAEIFRFQNMDIVGTSTLNVGPDFSLCFPDPAVLDAGCTGSWSGGTGTFSTPNLPTTTYTPSAGENGSTVNLTFTSTTAGTSTCMVSISDNLNVTFNALQDPAFNFNDWCQGSPNGPTGILTPGGTFSFNPNPGGGVTINPSTGVITGAVNSVVYTVQYTTPGPCPGTLTTDVMQNPTQIASFMFDDFCVGDANGPTLLGVPGGTYSFNPPSGNSTTINPITGEITNEVAGVYTVRYDTPGPCPGFHTFPVTITAVGNVVLPALGPYCVGGPNVNLPTTITGIMGNWSGTGVSGNSFNPGVGAGTYTLIFTPDPNQCANVTTTSVQVIASPTGSLVGNPVLCPGQCGAVNFSFMGGSGTYNITMNVSAGPFNFNFPMVGVTNTTTLNLCLSNTPPIFNPATNTLNIPTFVPPGTYTLTLISLTDAGGGPCANGTVLSGTLSLTIGVLPPANDLTLTLCDLDGDGMEIFNLTSNNGSVTVPPNSVIWFSDAALTTMIASPSSFSATNGTVVYAHVTSAAGCEAVADVTLNLTPPTIIPGPTFNGCANGALINLPASVGAATGGVWSGMNLVNGNTQFDPTGLPAGNYSIVYTPPPALCIAPITATVVLGAGAPITMTNPFTTACVGEPNVFLPADIGGVTGTWSGPSVSGNTFLITVAGTFTLTFTPSAGQCFTANTTDIIVNPSAVLTPVTFTAICTGSPNVNLPTTVGGFAGNWNGFNVVANVFDGNSTPGTYNLTFNPDNPCVTSFTSQIVVNPLVNLIVPPLGPTCLNGTPINLPTSIQGVNGVWTFNASPITIFNPASFGTGTFNLVFTPAANSCANVLNTSITVGQIEAGNNRTIKLCLVGIDTINLNSYLSTGATLGGSWTLGGLSIVDPINYDISLLPADTFTYRYFISNPLCGSDSAFITFITTDPNNAGPNSLNLLCQNDTRFVNFRDRIILADSTGFWVSPTGFSVNFSNIDSVDISSLGAGNFEFLYIVGQNDCSSDTSMHEFRISSFNSAGTDDVSTACIGGVIDLSQLINTSFTAGIYSNPGLIPGLVGSLWNTTGLIEGTYNFEYITLNSGACNNDTANIVIFLDDVLNAGAAQGNFYCEDEVLILENYIIDPLASRGGKFFTLSGTEIIGGLFDTKSSIGNIVFYYVVGDNIICPRDTAIYTFTRIAKPSLSFNVLGPICETECTTLKIDHNIVVGSQAHFRLVVSNGQSFNRIVNIVDFQSILLQFCGASNPPYNFGNLRPNLSYTVFLDSIITPNNLCNFDFGQMVQFNVIPLPTKLVRQTLCKGTTLTIGGDVYSESKPSGTTIIAVPPNIGCDTVVTVDLTFIDVSPITDVRRTTCNQSFSIIVGTTTFNRNNPNGQVTLKNIGGCDSIVNVNLTFVPPPVNNITQTTCDQNRIYTFGGQTFNSNKPSGSVILPNGSVFGCDSTINVNITYLPTKTSNIQVTTCDQAFFVTVGNQRFDKSRPTGMVTLPAAASNGCDSIVDVQLSFVSSVVNPLFITTCDPGFKITIGNQTFDASRPVGQSVLINGAVSGCDSIVNVDIQFTNFNVTNSLIYGCDDPRPTLKLDLANQPGPYNIALNGQIIASNQAIPYSTTLSAGANVIVITTTQGCKDTIELTVTEQTGPNVTLTQSPLNGGFTQITTIAPTNSIYDLSWTSGSTLSCNDCPDPIASPGPSTTYILTYSYGTDCQDSVLITIAAERKDTIVLPNIISVNGNSSNSSFYIRLPENLNGLVKSMRIYDRWGNLMFNKKDVAVNDPSVGWDATLSGNKVETGVYIYVIELELVGQSKLVLLKGDITVVK